MRGAIEGVRRKEFGLKVAAKRFNVPRATLQRRCRSTGDIHMAASKRLGSRVRVFTREMEAELVKHVQALEGMLFPMTPKRLRELAYQFAEANGCAQVFSREKKEAGMEWYRGFINRNSLSLRVPEATSAARARGFNRVSVAKFFELLKQVMDKFHFTADRIFNVDETGITTVPNKPSKVLATVGKRQVGIMTSAERGQLVTVEICFSAAGHYIPPLFVFPRVRMKPELMDRAPPGSVGVPHASGWMQSDIFTQWLKHFITHTTPTATRPVLLILDGHKTHTANLDVINLARENNITILCLPPHCSHRLQPLDVGFMKPLMTFYTQEVEKWLRNQAHRARVVTTFQVAELFGLAYIRAASVSTAVNAFRKTGICPCDPDVFTDADFASAAPTDIAITEPQIDQNTATVTVVDPQVGQTSANLTNMGIVDPRVGQTSANPTNLDIVDPQVGQTSSTLNPMGIAALSVVAALSQTSLTRVSDLSPLPKIVNSSGAPRKASAARGKTAILTASPFKQELEQKLQARNKPTGKAKTSSKIQAKIKNPCSMKSRGATNNDEQQAGQSGLKSSSALQIKTKQPDVDGDDVPCLFCGEMFLKSKSREKWVKCIECDLWAHNACTGHDSPNTDYICDLCKDD
jgi:hypothetical protein